MSIGSVTSSSAATQANWISKVDNANSTGAAGQAHRPPPPPDGGAMIGALADALQSIGVTATSAADDGSATTSSNASSDASTSATSGDGSVAQALGGFLHELMGALHAQGGADGGSRSGTPPDGQAYGPPGGPGGAGGPGGPGRLSSDLQSLISALGGGASSTSSADATSTDSTDSTSTSGSVNGLETSFKNLLQALGSDTSNSNDKLSSFLQTLADKLPGAGTSGNLVNTTV